MIYVNGETENHRAEVLSDLANIVKRIENDNKKANERVAVYIDIANIEASLCDIMDGAAIDYPGLVDHLVGERTLVAAYVFDACRGDDFRQRRMKKVTSNPKFRPIMLRYDPNRQEQKGVDMAMGLRMYDEAVRDIYDVAVIVSGDADFIPAMEFIQRAGKRAEASAFRMSANGEIECASDAYVPIDDLSVICLTGTAKHTEKTTNTIVKRTRVVA